MTANRTNTMTARTRIAITQVSLLVGATAANADFLGLEVESTPVDQSSWNEPDHRDLYTVSIYARFDADDDELKAIWGNSDDTLVIRTSDPDGFYQEHASGAHRNTSLDIPANAPSEVAADSFITIGARNQQDNVLQTMAMDYASFNEEGELFCGGASGVWFTGPSVEQGIAGNNPDNRVLIGQFTMARFATLDGQMNLAWFSGGQYEQQSSVALFARAGTCIEDVSGADGQVDSADLLHLLAAYGQWGSDVDVNGDEVVDAEDVRALLGAWGQCD